MQGNSGEDSLNYIGSVQTVNAVGSEYAFLGRENSKITTEFKSAGDEDMKEVYLVEGLRDGGAFNKPR